MTEIGQALRDIVNRVSTFVVTITLDMSSEIVCHTVTMQPTEDEELRHQIGHMVSDNGTVLDQSAMTATVTINRGGERSTTGIATNVGVEIKRLCQEAADRYFQRLGPFVSIQTYLTLARQCLQEFRAQSKVPTKILLGEAEMICSCPCEPCVSEFGVQEGPNIIIPGPYHILQKSMRVPLCTALASAFRAMLVEMIDEVPAEQVALEPPAPQPPDRPSTPHAETPAVDSVRDDLECLEKLRAQSGFASREYIPPDEHHGNIN